MTQEAEKRESAQRIGQAKFERVPLMEQYFEDRYGRVAEVYRAITKGEDKRVDYVTVHIKENGEKYTITEYLTKDQTTDYVLSGKEGAPRKYRDYLQAEVYVADLIGQKRRKEKTLGNPK